MHDAKETEVRDFINEARELKTQGLKNDADAVLVVSTAANKELYRRIGKESDMNDVLEEIFKDKIDETEAKGEEKAKLADIKNLMDSLSISAKDAMKALKISAKEQKRYIAML